MQLDPPASLGASPSHSAASSATRAIVPSAAGAGRLEALDVTKGILVVLMVVYHSLNYSSDYRIPFRYLSFLPPSFILITGFLLSHVYLARRTLDAVLCGRLLTRGAKLLLLFTALNVAGQFVRSQNYHGPSRGFFTFLEEWHEVFIWGGSRNATFDVLLPIAYLLLLSPALLWLTRTSRAALFVLNAALLGACVALEREGDCPPNLTFIAAGTLGMLLGLLPAAALATAARFLFLAAPGYAALFLLSQKHGQPFLGQMLAAVLALTIIYGVSLLLGARAFASRRLITLGQHSLLGYIAQIGILQIYSHFAGRPAPISAALFAMFGVTLALTVLAAELTDWAQARSKPFRALYRAIIP